MPLIFGNEWLDLGKFPHLMPQGVSTCAREIFTATTADRRREGALRLGIVLQESRPARAWDGLAARPVSYPPASKRAFHQTRRSRRPRTIALTG